MTQTRRRTRRIDPEVYNVIVEMASRPTPFSGPRIREALERQFGYERLPSVRTIQDVIREVAAPLDVGQRWSLLTSDGEEASLVLPAISELIRGSMGRINGMGKPLAELVVKISRAAPGIPPTEAIRMAARYVAADEANASTEHLDAYLALGAWDDKARTEAIGKGWLPPDWWRLEARNG
jgi:hypothetical protein